MAKKLAINPRAIDTLRSVSLPRLATVLLFSLFLQAVPGNVARSHAQEPDSAPTDQWEEFIAAAAEAGSNYEEKEKLLKLSVHEAEKLGSEDLRLALSLGKLANLYSDQGKYAESESLLKRSLAIWETALGPEHPAVAESINDLANLYLAQGKYADAEPLYKRSLAFREKVLGPEHPDVAASLNDLANLYEAQGKYAEAEQLYKRSLAISEKVLGPEHPDVAASLNNLAVAYEEQGKYAEAEQLHKRSLAISEKVLGPEHPDVAGSLNNLAILYESQGKYAEAEQLHKRSLAISEKVLGPEHPDVAATLNGLANLYNSQGKYAEAEQLYKRSLAISEKVLGPEYPDVAATLNGLANLYITQSKYAEAELLFKRSLAIKEKALGSEHQDMAVSLNNLAILYNSQGKYAEATPLSQRSLTIFEKVFGLEHLTVAASLHNLAILYESQGKYAEAEPLYKRSLAIREKILGEEHREVAATLNGLASLYDSQGKHAEAEPLFKRSLAIGQKALGAEHPEVAVSLNNLAILYESQGKYAEAEPLFKRSLAIKEKALGTEHPEVAASLNNLAVLYEFQGKYAEAEMLHQRSLVIKEKAFGPEHPEVGRSINNLARLYRTQGKNVEAEPFFERSLANLAKQFQHHFSYMSEKDRLSFLDSVSSRFPLYYSFCLANRDRNPALIGKMYDVLLWQKGLVVQSIAALRSQVAAAGDPETLRLLDELTVKRTQLANLLAVSFGDSARWRQPMEPRGLSHEISDNPSGDPAQWRQRVEQLEEEANQLEAELVVRSTRWVEQKRLASVTWSDVKKALGEGEAAIEFAHFPFFDGKVWTGKTYYVALVVTSEVKTPPNLVFLGEAEELEKAPMLEYRELVELRGPAHSPQQRSPQDATPDRIAEGSFYRAFWKPLEPALRGIDRVYLSPDGILNLVSWAVVPTGEGHLLADIYDLRLVSSTKDLLREKASVAANVGVLIGNPDFDIDESEYRSASQELASQENAGGRSEPVRGGFLSRDQERATLSPLPGTEKELQSIYAQLEKQDWQVEVYSGQNALEEAVKRVQGPRVLHLATHGFFLENQEDLRRDRGADIPSSQENPMLRSGLFFAGANRGLRGAAPSADLDDGVLTAYEAMGLNLQGTELVVLSACQTGLGQVRNGEGCAPSGLVGQVEGNS